MTGNLRKDCIRQMRLSKSLFIGTDASSQVGLGHIMCSLALVQAWEKKAALYSLLIEKMKV